MRKIISEDSLAEYLRYKDVFKKSIKEVIIGSGSLIIKKEGFVEEYLIINELSKELLSRVLKESRKDERKVLVIRGDDDNLQLIVDNWDSLVSNEYLRFLIILLDKEGIVLKKWFLSPKHHSVITGLDKREVLRSLKVLNKV